MCLLWGFRHPGARAPRGRGAVRAPQPGAHVSTSHETAGVFREYERCATTVVDAALSPLTGGYLARAGERAVPTPGLPEPEVMLSSGGAADAATAARHAAWTVLSGPAGGAVAQRPGGRAAGRRRRRGARHGRHVVRRVAGARGRRGREHGARGGRPRARPADGGRAHGRRRRRVDRLARRRRRAAGGPALRGRRPGSRLLRPRRTSARPSPTPTCCWAASTPARRWPAASASTGSGRASDRARWPASSASLRWRPHSGSCGSPNTEMAAAVRRGDR